MSTIGTCLLLSCLLQDPAPAKVDPFRIAIQADGTASILRADGAAPVPLFGGMFDERSDASLMNAFRNYGLAGNLGLFLGSSRPVSTMLDPEHYCQLAGIKREPAALLGLAGPAPEGADKQRRALDRLVALTLLARGDEAARRTLVASTDPDDKLAVRWATHLAGGRRSPLVLPGRDLASVLATVPATSGVVVVADHANMPHWDGLWRVMRDAGRATSRAHIAMYGMDEEDAAKALTQADEMVERTALLGFEFARRIGNACLARTVLAGPTAFNVGPNNDLWLHFDGWFDPDQVAEGLGAEGLKTERDGDTVRAKMASGATFVVTRDSFAVRSDPQAATLGAERAKELAATLSAPNLAVGIALEGANPLGANPLPATVGPLVDDLRAILLRHDGSGDGSHLWLELRYGDGRPAAAAAATLGALLAAASAAAGEAPKPVREVLRELRVARNGTTVSVEVELDEPLGAWAEGVLPAMYEDR